MVANPKQCGWLFIARRNYGQLNSNLGVLAQPFRLRLRQWPGNLLARVSGMWECLACHARRRAPMEIIMKTTVSILFAAAPMLSSAPANAVKLDLSTMTC
jgi:hypothetical protein